MPNEPIVDSRRALPVFYVLDTSGSMSGEPIDSLNAAMRATTNALRQVAAHNGDAKLKVAVLSFDTDARWLQPAGPEDMEDFIWTNLQAGGYTFVDRALKELNEKLSKDSFLASETGLLYPIIIFMSDGYAMGDYRNELNRISKNRYFKNAVKVGFAIGDKPDVEMIARVVGNPEAVLRTENLGVFAKLIRFASVTSSTMASVSHVTGNEITGSQVVAKVLGQEDFDASEVVLGVEVLDDDVVSEIQKEAVSPDTDSYLDYEEW